MASQSNSLVVNPSTSSVTATFPTTPAADAPFLQTSSIATFLNDDGLKIVTRLVEISSQTPSITSTNNGSTGSQK
ncbi:hypothetical protein RB595_007226 [Gaeumannomyces hyphopodioides]